MKILVLDFDDIKNPLLGAGQAISTLEVFSRLAKKGHQIRVLCSRYPGYQDRTENGIEYLHIGLGSHNIRLNNFAYIFALPFTLIRQKADLVVECFTAPMSTLLSPLFTKIPVVVIPSCFDAARFTKLYHLPFDRIERWGIKLYRYFLPYTTELNQQILKDNSQAQCRIVPEGVGARFFEIMRQEPKHILMLSRMDIEQKGIDLLLQAVAIIKNNLTLPIVLAGNGPDEDKVRAPIIKLGLADKVFMTGPAYNEAKAELLSHSLFTILPSRNETFSCFALEAMAAGQPIITFDIPGLAWTDTNACLKVPAFDIERLAQTILELSQQPEKIESMSLAGRKFAQQYDWDHVVEEYEDFFQDIVNPNSDEPIYVTKAYLPNQDKYQSYLDQVWQTGWLTNNGQLVQKLEQKLQNYFGVKHVLYTSNGTIALQVALKALNITGEVITTPYSYVATTTSIIWEHCQPVFVDIDPQTLCIDPAKIEAAISPRTQAIMAVHVYGIACDVKVIDQIAKKHNLKVIYDAAHAFGTQVDGQSVLNWGDISTLSFHATKLFHTVEGGAIVTNNDELAKKIDLLRSFGHVDDDHYLAGINGKNSEFHAAMGLTNLDDVDQILARRLEITAYYDQQLATLFQNSVIHQPSRTSILKSNRSYYPVFFKNEATALLVKAKLAEHKVYARRYFYPSLNTLPYVKYQVCPVSEKMALSVLCLPLYHTLTKSQINRICRVITSTFNSFHEKI